MCLTKSMPMHAFLEKHIFFFKKLILFAYENWAIIRSLIFFSKSAEKLQVLQNVCLGYLYIYNIYKDTL